MKSERDPQARAGGDAGMTLIELLVTISVLGLLALSISAALTVTLRTQRDSDGRLNVARAEQNIDVWLPADLSSAVTATSKPGDVPCTAPCPNGVVLDGSSALLLKWPSISGNGETVVSYMYRVSNAAEDKYELVRIECDNGSCSRNVILRDLTGPPSSSFDPGVTEVPSAVVNVALPLSADATSIDGVQDKGSSARRIVVSINGGGTSVEGGGGLNKVSITAGGTTISTLVPEKVTGPSFVTARSRCGGPITVVVDDSGSIGTDVSTVESSVIGFINALAGTSTSVQVVPFSAEATVIGAGSAWNKYFDMAVESDVATLVGNGPNSIRANLDADTVGGGTNWEDAMFRALYAKDGRRLDKDGTPATNLPGLVVFFTDGEPTLNRLRSVTSQGSLADGFRGGGGAKLAEPPANASYWPVANGHAFDQEGFDRASYLIKDLRELKDIRFIGVGVGGITTTAVIPFTDAALKNSGFNYRYNNRYLQRYHPQYGWQTFSFNTSGRKVLGNFIAGGELFNSSDTSYVESTYSNGAWSEIDTAHTFVTSDFSKLPSALAAIAVGQCGGTLTLQTRLADGTPAPSNVTYESKGETVTTSLVNRAPAFDVTLPDGLAATTVVTPQSFDQSGYSPQAWSCRSKGVPLDPSKWSLVEAGKPGKGIRVTVSPNAATSCTLQVSS